MSAARVIEFEELQRITGYTRRADVEKALRGEGMSAIHEPHLPPDGASIYRGISGEQFHGSSAS